MKKNKYILGAFALLLGMASCTDYTEHDPYTVTYPIPDGKSLYRPREFSGQDWRNETFQYCYDRAAYTDNLAIFWESGFGKDLASPPSLEGTDMSVDLDNLKTQLEKFYKFYRDDLGFHTEGSKADKYRMMVMLQYSLDGTAYGGTYDNTIGAFWAAPNRLKDSKLNTVAHELGHSFQLQLQADGAHGFDSTFGGIYEMTSQWMLWQINPNWIDDETYHWDAFKGLTHKAFLHGDNIYHSPYVLEYWSQKHGKDIMAKLWKAAQEYQDPVVVYQNVTGTSQQQFLDEMYDCYARLVNFDFDRVRDVTRKYANSFPSAKEYMNEIGDGWLQVDPSHCPENYGFNALKLEVPAAGSTVTVSFNNIMGDPNYTCDWWWCGSYRFGFVGVTESGKSIYGEIGTADFDNRNASVSFELPKNEQLAHLWLVVTAGPKDGHWSLAQLPLAQWPYQVKFNGTKLI